MTDRLFGYGGDIPPLDEGPEDEEGDFYDNVNDDTFGTTGAEAGDWEDAHERMAEEFHFGEEPLQSAREGDHDDMIPFFEEEDLEKSITKLVLDDDDSYFDPAIKRASKSKPISIGNRGGESSISQLFGPKSPPSLFDPTEFMSPTRNIWGSPEVHKTVEMPLRNPLAAVSSTGTEERLKAMLNIGQELPGRGGDAWEDPAIVRAVSDAQPVKKKIMSLAELEEELMAGGGKTPVTKALPARSVSPEIGSPPISSIPLPIGTPPMAHSMLHHAALPQAFPPHITAAQHGTPPPLPTPQQQPAGMGSPLIPIHPQLLQQLTRQIHHSIGGRVSPTQISQLIIRLHAGGGRLSPNSIRKAVFTNIPPPPRGPNASPAPVGVGSPGMRPPFHAGSPFASSSPMGISPMGARPGTSPGGGNTPPMHPHPMGAGRGGRGMFPRAMHGLTPMNPRIPPVHSRPDQGGMNRRYPYNVPPRGPHHNMQKYDRGDGPRAQRQIRFQRGGDNQSPYRRGNRGDFDEYACLMSQKEKEWVIKIQMLQLTSSNPAVDDFYFQNYMQRKAAKEKDREENGKASQQDGGGGGGGRKEKKLVLRPLESKAYQPAQFEGALGKLTSASVNNPRQIIDIHIDNAPEEEEGGKPSAKDHGRRRRTLLVIERLYSMVLVIEDLDLQVRGLPESDHGPLLERRRGLVGQLCATLTGDSRDGLSDRTVNSQLHQILGIRKGRKLVTRVTPLLGKEEALPLVQTLLANFLYVLKQETKELKKEALETFKGRLEETLPQMYPAVSQVIREADLTDLSLLVSDLQSQVPTTPTATTPKGSTVISSVVQNKLGISIVLCVLNRAEELFLSHQSSPEHTQWTECVHLFAEAICVVSDTAIARPLGKFPLVLDHFSRFVSKQPLNALEKRLRTLIDHEE